MLRGVRRPGPARRCRSTRAAGRRSRRPGCVDGDRLRIVEPLGYVDFLSLVRGAALVVTDSGGIQEETTVLGVPCLTVRPNTERPITITHGTNRLVEPEDGRRPRRDDPRRTGCRPPADGPPLWDGRAGERIAEVIDHWLAAAVSPQGVAEPADHAAVSYWLETAGDDLTPRPALDGSTDADVAILGAGLTGPVDRVLPRTAATRRCGS